MRGQYKVDIFSGKTLVKTTDWFTNDITNTGVLYPYTYSFARCFMFLSLGLGQFTELGNGLQSYTGFNGTNGATAIVSYPTNDGNTQTGSYMGWQSYASGGASTTACGTQFTPNGLNMFRAWNVPTGNVAVGGAGLEIDSFMVSPSSGTDPTGCFAFSCVNQPVFIASGYNATIYYQLSLNFSDYSNSAVYFPTGVNSNGYFNTGSANIGGLDTTLVSGWANLSGIYRQLFPGLQCVDNNGACVVTDHGAMLEPNLLNPGNLYFYLSPDISAYAVSKYDGTGLLTENSAYNSNGLCANYSEYCSNYVGPSNPTAAITKVINNVSISDPNSFYYGNDVTNGSSSVFLSNQTPVQLTATNQNIHLKNFPNLSGYSNLITSFTYNQTNFVNATGQQIAYASPGSSLFTTAVPNYGQPAVFSTALTRVPPNPNVGGRVQKVTKSSRISPIQALGWNARYGSMVLANINGLTTPETVVAYPYMEYLFFDTSGRAANMPHYRYIPEIYLLDRGTGVAQVVFSITGAGVNGGPNSPIQMFWNVTGFMGPYQSNSSGLNGNYPWTGYISGTDPTFGNGTDLPSGFVFSGTSPKPNLSGSTSIGQYGYGAVYGIIVPFSGFYALPTDTCLLDNPVWSGFSGDKGWNTTPNPTGETGLLCWPTPGIGLNLVVSGMKYYYPTFATNYIYDDTAYDYIGSSGYQLVGDVTGSAGTSLLGSSVNATYTINGFSITVNTHQITASTTGFSSAITSASNGISGFVPTNFRKPVGRIHHMEIYSGNGQRLLPNYASGTNKTGIDSYSPIYGGAFPGLSSQNGMQIFFDFIWSA